ncbi:MAG: phosphotransferase [Actinomycetota bacterium]
MADASFPRNPEDLSADWLSEKLGRAVSSFESEQIGIGVGLLGRLFRLSLSGDDGAPSNVVAKFPTLDEGARMNVVEPLRFYEKEVRFYQQDPTAIPVSTPELYAADFDPATGDFVLLFEDCGGRRMEDQIAGCSLADAQAAVDAMVPLHAHWWENDFGSVPWLPRYNEPPYPQVLAAMFKQAWPRALEAFGDHLSPKYLEFGERFVDLVPWFMEEATNQPLTFCHGDYRLDNLFFGTKPEHAPVTIVDWQISFRGRGGYDLGYFVSQSLATEERRPNEEALIERYRSGLEARGIDYPLDELMKDYRRTIAWCFIYPVVSAGQIELTNERMRQLILGILARAVQAIDDTGALETLP